MFSYVYMKVLESQPWRYDRGIRWLSCGQAVRVAERIAADEVAPGMGVLDIGCGTGTLAVCCARRGAGVVGFDISAGMLAVARQKVAAEGLDGHIELIEMGIAGMERFSEGEFDLVTAILVLSELAGEERSYALSQARRVLKPGGRLIVADEVRPGTAWKRLLHGALRLPLAVTTFISTQTTTKAVAGLEQLVCDAGFRVQKAERTGLDSFIYLVAVKGGG